MIDGINQLPAQTYFTKRTWNWSQQTVNFRQFHCHKSTLSRWNHGNNLHCSVTNKCLFFTQGGAPSSYKLVINPLTIDISPTKTIVIGFINQLSYRTGAPPCRCHHRWCRRWCPPHRRRLSLPRLPRPGGVFSWRWCPSSLSLQDGAPKIAKLVYKWFNFGLW